MQQNITLLRLPKVITKTGLQRTSIYGLEAAGDFPRRIKVGPRATAWAEHEIDEWLAARMAARELQRVAS